MAAHVAQSIGFKLHLKKDQLARHGIFRLGYWKHTTSGYVVYGIRMMLHDMDLERTDLSADANLDHISIQALKPFAVNAQRAYHERTESAWRNASLSFGIEKSRRKSLIIACKVSSTSLPQITDAD